MSETSGVTCPWCSAPAAADASTCSSCGAALAQRESIGGLAIPGVTSVDPALSSFDAQPLHLKPPGPTQSVAAGVIPALALGGPVALAALGGIAAVAAAEYRGASGGGSGAAGGTVVGAPSEAARLAVERLDRGELGEGRGDPGQHEEPEAHGEPGAADPWRDLPGG